jgi:hypothetical protein
MSTRIAACADVGSSGNTPLMEQCREQERWLDHEKRHGYIRARLRLLSTEEGGRQNPIFHGHRSCWGFPPEVHPYMHDAPLVIEQEWALPPGGVATVRLHPLWPEHWPDIQPGLLLGMFEGSRLVGRAEVLKVVPATA